MCRPTSRRSRNPDLTHVPLSLLREWIDCEMVAQIDAGKTFTAYSITRALRAAHPCDDIPHEEVQERVHDQMGIVSHYGLSWEIWNGEVARTYAPLCLTPPVTFSGFPLRKRKRSKRIDWGRTV